MLDIIFLRVSKEQQDKSKEDYQDPKQQLKAIVKKFNLNLDKCLVLQEKISGYDIEKLPKRKDFLRLLNILFDSEKTTIKDLFLSNFQKKQINLYFWDYHRNIRNFEFGVLFYLLIDLFNITIYSCKGGKINKLPEETPIQKFSRYILYSINAFSAEDYSYTISTNVRKAVEKKEGLTISSKGNRWGRPFRDISGNTVKLSIAEIKALNQRIVALMRYYRKQKILFYYGRIIEKIKKESGLQISKAYISRLKK